MEGTTIVGRFRVYDSAHRMWDCECGGNGKAQIVGKATMGQRTDRSGNRAHRHGAASRVAKINERWAELWRKRA